MKNKIAIFVCGSGGSGKTTFCNKYFNNFAQINVDIFYERLLIESGLGLKIKDFNEYQLVDAAKLFELAKIENDTLFYKCVANSENIVIDGIGRDSNIILYQRNYLHKMGYDTFMIMLYESLEKCLERISVRDRVYNENITIDSWYLAYGNMDTFKNEFKDNFAMITNTDTFEMDINSFLNKSNFTKSLL